MLSGTIRTITATAQQATLRPLLRSPPTAPLPPTQIHRTMSSAQAATPYTKYPSTQANAGGVLAVPGGLYGNELSDPQQEKSRINARQLLPWNYGRALEPTGTQTLQPVGHPTLAQRSSDRPVPALFSPLTVNGRPFLKNRIVVSPMCMYSAEDGFANDFHLAHLGQFAIGGAGLVVVEATAVAFEGRISTACLGLWKDEQAAPLKRIVQLLHAMDTRAGIQLGHAGRKASTMTPFHLPRTTGIGGTGVPTAEAVSEEVGGWPSEVMAPSAEAFSHDYFVPHEMSLERIAQLTQQFVSATQRAVDAGFDYIEIHAAHGYLLTEFLSATSNKRTDAYGGSFENRTRLLREVVAAMRAVFPSERGVLGVRLSCIEWVDASVGGWTLDDTKRLVAQLKPLGVDLIDCSSGGNSVSQKITVGPGYQTQFAQAVKASQPDLLVGAVGLITEASQAEAILTSGQADVVLLARELLRNPRWPLDAAKQLDYDVEWVPQYQRAKPSARGAANAAAASGQRS